MVIVNSDDTLIDGTTFSYDQAVHELTIDTKDLNKIGSYPMKLVAQFADTYTNILA